MSKEKDYINIYKTEKSNKYDNKIKLFVFGTIIQYFIIFLLSFSNKNNSDKKISILVASKNIPKGKRVQIDDLNSILLNLNHIDDYFIKSSETAEIIGQSFQIDIPKETPLTKIALFNEFQKNSIPENIPTGKRLVVLETNLGELSNAIKPGDKVDILAHMNLPDLGEVTKTILEDVTLIGIGNSLFNKKENDSYENNNYSSSISIYLTPKDAEFILFAQNKFKFTLNLRNPNDSQKNIQESGITFSEFLEHPKIKNISKNQTFKIFNKTNIIKTP